MDKEFLSVLKLLVKLLTRREWELKNKSGDELPIEEGCKGNELDDFKVIKSERILIFEKVVENLTEEGEEDSNLEENENTEESSNENSKIEVKGPSSEDSLSSKVITVPESKKEVEEVKETEPETPKPNIEWKREWETTYQHIQWLISHYKEFSDFELNGLK